MQDVVVVLTLFQERVDQNQLQTINVAHFL